jgi:hypothetical protein
VRITKKHLRRIIQEELMRIQEQDKPAPPGTDPAETTYVTRYAEPEKTSVDLTNVTDDRVKEFLVSKAESGRAYKVLENEALPRISGKLMPGKKININQQANMLQFLGTDIVALVDTPSGVRSGEDYDDVPMKPEYFNKLVGTTIEFSQPVPDEDWRKDVLVQTGQMEPGDTKFVTIVGAKVIAVLERLD